MEITSATNPKIKKLLALQQKSSERRKERLFVVEGQRELMHCIQAGYELEAVFVREGMLVDLDCPNIYEVSAKVYEKIAYRGTTEGIIAEVRPKESSLDNLMARCKSKSPVFVVLEAVEKPGNLGAILRSADAAGIDGVIVCDPLTDLYNPNLIRSSLGAVFTVPMAACTSEECIAFLKANGIQILTAQLQDSHLYYDTDMRRSTAIIMGTESTGLTDVWRKAADAHIRIPMLGKMDSLNVSVSAAILMFEAVRQRSL